MKAVSIILGLTSTGKTSLAIDLCSQLNGEIISADSRQIYKGMDIGTGKLPVKADFKVEKHENYWVLDGIKIWGYDLVNPDEYFSAYDFAKWALPKAAEVMGQGKNVFLVGGTGFFIDFFTGRSTPAQVEPDFNLRKKLEKLTLEKLQKKLMSLNQEVYERVDKQNPARLIRAIEIENAKHQSPTPLPYLQDVTFNFIGLQASREFLYEKADKWLDLIWQNGLLPETQSLISAGFTNTRPLNGIVYKSAKAFLNAELSEDVAKQQAKFDLHAYIRRQETYFKKNPDIKWFDIETSTEDIAKLIKNHVKSS